MFVRAIQIILIFLLIFTPVAFGSMDIWAFSLMELGILLILSLYSIQESSFMSLAILPIGSKCRSKRSRSKELLFRKKKILRLSFGFALSVSSGHFIPADCPPIGDRSISFPKTFEIRQLLSCLPLNPSPSSNPVAHVPASPLSVYPFATQIEFFKWMSLIGFFFFLVYGKLLDDSRIRTGSFWLLF